MEGFKLIKTSLKNEKKIVGVFFDGQNDYELFIAAAKKVHNLKDSVGVYVFSNEFLISEDIFSSFVCQFIGSQDFVLEIHLEINTDNVSDPIILIDEPIPTSSITGLLNLPQEKYLFCNNDSINDVLPTTEEIRQIPTVQINLNVTPLGNKNRTQIAKAVIFQILNNNANRKLLREDFLQLAKSITEIFPSEVVATYYVPFAKGHIARGKLYDAYNNTRSRLSAAGIITRRIKSKPELHDQNEYDIIHDSDIEEYLLEILESGCGEWDLVVENWRKTHSYRQRELKNENLSTNDYIEKYKVLQNDKCLELFNLDYSILYPTSKNIYVLKLYYKKIIDLSIKIKDNSVKEILSYINQLDDEDSVLAFSLMLLPYLLPTSRKRSKIEVQESFICYSKNILILDEEIRSASKRAKVETQPKVYMVGDSNKLICLAYLDLCGRKYKTKNPLHAIEACFHCFMSMNIKYPKPCEHIWILIQKLLFQINTPWDTDIPAVNTLINDLQKK